MLHFSHRGDGPAPFSREESYPAPPAQSSALPADDQAGPDDLWLSPASCAEEGLDASSWGPWADLWRYELTRGVEQ